MLDPAWIGTIFTIASAAIGVMAFLWSIRGNLDVIVERMKNFDTAVNGLTSRISTFESQFAKVSDAMMQLARQDERLNSLDERISAHTTNFHNYQERVDALLINQPKKRTR
jgi:predicted  nucleic acid-binding Zn-ribbon protein